MKCKKITELKTAQQEKIDECLNCDEVICLLEVPGTCGKCKCTGSYKLSLDNSIYTESGELWRVRYKCIQCGHISATYEIMLVSDKLA